MHTNHGHHFKTFSQYLILCICNTQPVWTENLHQIQNYTLNFCLKNLVKLSEAVMAMMKVSLCLGHHTSLLAVS